MTTPLMPLTDGWTVQVDAVNDGPWRRMVLCDVYDV